MTTQRPIRRALLSVWDKSGVVDFARALVRHGVEILSTGGTARALREAGVELRDVGDHTGFPEMMDGRVKTLHPKVHGGILFRRDDPAHVRAAEEHGIGAIDLVCVNLYPFEATIRRPGVTTAEAIEQIDIGGPSMVRSAAKNHADVTIVVDPGDYGPVVEAMDASGGATTPELRRELAARAFARTASYDAAIAAWMARELVPAREGADARLPERFSLDLPRARILRYGENPHQAAALYGSTLDRFEQLHGKEVSYNNLLDLTGALEVAGRIRVHGDVAVAIIKHSNPCGAAVGASVGEAWRRALATDPVSASGGIIAVSAEVDEDGARAMADHFIEVLVAPSFTPEALEILRSKKNRILLRARDDRWLPEADELLVRSVLGGVVAQTADAAPTGDGLRVVTERAPTEEEYRALLFAWDIVRCVKSNAIVYASATQTLGVGAGQMSRVDSARIAAWKAQEAGLALRGSVVASDAFFPFADGLLAAADAGASAAIQPGGSVRDDEVIAAADERGIAMVFTGRRHFRH